MDEQKSTFFLKNQIVQLGQQILQAKTIIETLSKEIEQLTQYNTDDEHKLEIVREEFEQSKQN